MDRMKSTVRTPENGASLKEYLDGFADEEMVHTLYNQDFLMEFCRILHNNFSDFENLEGKIQILRNVTKRVNDVDYLIYCTQKLESIIKQILELLDTEEEKLKRLSKIFTFGRILGSSVYIAGMVGHVWMKNSNPGRSKLCFGVAVVFGLLGYVTTTAEMTNLRYSFEQLIIMIRRDQELMAPIQRWYQQTTELEATMEGAFTSKVLNLLADDFAKLRNKELTPVTLLGASLRSVAEGAFEEIRDEKLILNFINFTLIPEYQEWIEWIIFRRHPFTLDATEKLPTANDLQLHFRPLQNVLGVSFALLVIADRYLSHTLFPLWGHISWNLVSIIDATNCLRKPERSTSVVEIRYLREHLCSQLESFQRITEFIRVRKRNRNLDLSQSKSDV